MTSLGLEMHAHLKRGWRWIKGELIFKKTWERDDIKEGVGELEVTRRVIHDSRMSSTS